MILSYLEPKELATISTVCKDFAEWVNSDVCFLFTVSISKDFEASVESKSLSNVLFKISRCNTQTRWNRHKMETNLYQL